MQPIEIFYSYSHKDELLRDELEKHLSDLRWQKVITSWHDRRILAGWEWAEEIDNHLKTADIILLLISPDFLASGYCYSVEVQRAVDRHGRGEAHIIPIILRRVHWEGAPFGKIQALPKDGRPVRSWPDQDEAFFNIVAGIREVIEELKGKRAAVSNAAEQPASSTILVENIPQSDPDIGISKDMQDKLPPFSEEACIDGVVQATILSYDNATSLEFLSTEEDSPDELITTLPPLLLPNQDEGLDQIVAETLSIRTAKQFLLKHILRGHSKAVRGVALNADGKTVVSSSDDKTVKVWNLETGELVSTFNGSYAQILFPNVVLAAATSYNGQISVSGGGDDKTVKVWNLETGELLRTFTGHNREVRGVAISADGKTIVSGGDDETVKVWDLEAGELLRTFTGHNHGVRGVAISTDGKTIVSGGDDETVKVWDLEAGELLYALIGHEHWVCGVAISADGKTIVSGSYDKTVRVWSLEP
jgi:TIR domain/WD domain, G-beta repeat